MIGTDGCWRACLATMLAGAFAVADASAGKPPPPPPAIQFDNTLDDYAVCTHVPSSHAKSARGAECCALARRAECRPLVIWRVVSYSTRPWLVPLKACVLSTTGPADEPERRVRAVFLSVSAFSSPAPPTWLAAWTTTRS